MKIHDDLATLRDTMRDKRVTVSALAKEAGVDRTRLSNVLNGITDSEFRNLRAAVNRLARSPRV